MLFHPFTQKVLLTPKVLPSPSRPQRKGKANDLPTAICLRPFAYGQRFARARCGCEIFCITKDLHAVPPATPKGTPLATSSFRPPLGEEGEDARI